MAESVNGEINVNLTTKDQGTADEVEGKAKKVLKPDQQLTGMQKIMAGIGKTLGKANPVFDMSNIVTYLLRKSTVLMGVLDPLLDILGAVVDVILKAFLPIAIPVLKMIAGSIPAIEVASKVIEGFLQPIADVLNWLAKIVQEGAGIIKKWLGGGGAKGAANVGKSVFMNATPIGWMAKYSKAALGLLSGEKKASGISYVPQTMQAELHRGESVLTARENRNRGNGGGINIMNPQFNITAGGTTTMDAKVFANQLYQQFNKKLTDESRRS